MYLYNRIPLHVIGNTTPYERLNGEQPDTSKIRVFGSNAYYAVNTAERSKIQPTFHRGVWIGWSERQNGNRILINDRGHVITTRDVKHDEQQFTHLAEIRGDLPAAGGNGLSFGMATCNPEPAPVNTGTVVSNNTKHQWADYSDADDDQSAPDEPDGLEAVNSAPPSPVPDHDNSDALSSDNDEYHSSSSTDDADNVESLNSANPLLQPPATSVITTRSGRAIVRPTQYGVIDIGDLDPDDQHQLRSGKLYAAVVQPGPGPLTWKQALAHPNAEQFVQAAGTELANMTTREVYTLVPYRPGIKPLKSRWVCVIKYNEHNQPVKYKARLVAKGFQQEHGIDYNETFAPVVKYKSMRLVLALAAQYRLVIHQIDFETAFLNAPLDEEIYLEQPEGFVIPSDHGKPRLVWKLQRAIYGLKQAPREWWHTINRLLVKLNYESIPADPCIYVKRMDGYQPIILTLYVDDTLAVFEPGLEHVWQSDKANIAKHYAISDLGPAKWILNMELQRSDDGSVITLSQQAYIEKMLDRFGMADAKPCYTPATQVNLFDPNLPPGKPLPQAEHQLYREIIGSALYAANTTRIDITWTVSMLSRFLSAPTSTHLTAAKHLLRYLKATAAHRMIFRSNERPYIHLSVYSDADWAGDKSNRKSMSGMLLQLNGNTVTWQSKKQECVSLSSMESEYVALSSAVCEIQWTTMWMQQLLGTIPTVTLYCDNQAAIAGARSDVYHDRTKHIDTRYHYFKQYIRDGSILLQWVPTTEQLADILTKSLGRTLHTAMTDRLLIH